VAGVVGVVAAVVVTVAVVLAAEADGGDRAEGEMTQGSLFDYEIEHLNKTRSRFCFKTFFFLFFLFSP